LIPTVRRFFCFAGQQTKDPWRFIHHLWRGTLERIAYLLCRLFDIATFRFRWILLKLN